MKKEVTRRYLKALYGDKAIQIGYGRMQHLFPEWDADFYTCGVYGWIFDAFCVNGYLVTTGYRNTFGIKPDPDLISEYEAKALILHQTHTDYQKLKNNLYKLRCEFVKKVFENSAG